MTRLAHLMVLTLVFGIVACVPEDMTEATMLLEDVAAGASQSRLKTMTPAPSRVEIVCPAGARSVRGDLYQPNQPVGGNLVLMPGFPPTARTTAG